MRAMVFGTYDAGLHPRVAVIAAGLAARGFAVEECNQPIEVGTAERVEALRRPWRLPFLALRVARAWVRLWRQARRLPEPRVVVVGYLGILDVHLARRLFPAATIVLDHLAPVGHTARDRALGGSVIRRLADRLDAAAVAAADLVVVDTEENLALLPAERRNRGVVVPVGAGSEWFRAPPAATAGPLRVVFYGLYTPLQAAPVIGAAMARSAGAAIEFTMIGNGQQRRATVDAAAGAQVTWLDWVDPEALPGLVADHEVALGIFGCTDKGRRVVPNKVYQGAAAGCAIVTSATDPQLRMLGDAAIYVPCDDPRALADVLVELSRDLDRVATLRQRAHDLARRAFTPEAVVAPLVARLSAEPAPDST